MIISIMSDSHDNIWNLRKAIALIRKANSQMIIHCGDFVAPFMLKELETAAIPVHGVFGNNDGDQYLLTKFSYTALKNITLHGIIGELDICGFKIAFAHHNIMAEPLSMTNKYNLVCFGHSHVYEQKNIGNTLLLNPGEIMGKDGFATFCLVDTDTLKVELVNLK
ncbi:MAG: metallophosphoesterase [Desulfobacterales bacterium]|nr:metallophosphoesterase [Desulfobacterales bacterium]MBF0398050.1 metallophosphoesterase [Desulfobacterales bacterium]